MRIGHPGEHHPPQSLHHGRSGKVWLHRDLVECLDHRARIGSAKRPAGHAPLAHSGVTPDPISP